MNQPNPIHRQPHMRGRLPSFKKVRFSTTQLLVTLILLFIASPFVSGLEYGEIIESGLMTMVLLSGVIAVGARRKTLLVGSLIATPAVLGNWARHIWPDTFSHTNFLVCAILFAGFVIFHLLHFVLVAPRVDREVLCASISAYLLLGLIWSFAYMLAWQLVPHAFSINADDHAPNTMEGSIAFYFSFVTLSTVGYGDIVPTHGVTRMLAVMESMTGSLYVGVLIARLVALYSSEQRSEDVDPPSETN